MTKLSCKQFAGYDKDNMSVIMMRLEGYYTDETGRPSSTSARWRATPRISSSIAAIILTTTYHRCQRGAGKVA